MSKTLSKADFVRQIALRCGARASVVNDVLEATGRVIREATATGQTVALPELGRFSQKTRAARTGRNPQTGAPVDIPERVVLTFRPSATKA